MRKTLTTKAARSLKPRPKTYTVSDPELRQHYVRVQPSGTKTYTVITYTQAGKQKWVVIGSADILDIDQAREKARAAIARIRDGLPAVEIPPESFEAVARQWVKRHVIKGKLRTEKRISQRLELHVFPFWKERSFLSIKRSDVAALLDRIEDNRGAAEADAVLKTLSSMMHWFARRDDDFRPPIVRGMQRYNTKQNARTRTLNDDEIRALWKATEPGNPYPPYYGLVRTALLTAQRRTKVATMKWDDISDDGEWMIRQQPREKNSAGSLVLPKLALDVIKSQPRLGDNPYVFASGRTDGPIIGFSIPKYELDARLPGIAPWTVHDLRRTARSLMSRAGVLPDIAERVLGHAIVGVAGTYNRYEYRDEKAEALRKLAALIDSIVNPRPDVVVPIRKAKRR